MENAAPVTATPTATPAASPAPASAPVAQKSSDAFRQRLLSNTELPSIESDSSHEETYHNQSEDAPVLDESVETPVEENAEPDYSWAQQLDAYKDGVHGVPLQELLQALSEGRIPDALLDKLHLQMKDGDETWEDTIQSARDGAMMRANYTKKLQAFAQERDAFNGEKAQLVDTLNTWATDPNAFLQGALKMKFPFEQAARLYVEKMVRIEQIKEREALPPNDPRYLAPGTAAALEAADQREAELAELRAERARAEQQNRQQTEKVSTEKVVEAVRGESMRQLQAAGLDMSGPGAQGIWNMYFEQVSAIWSAKGAPPSRMEIAEAVRATKEMHNKYVRSAQATAAAKPAAPKLGAKPLDGAKTATLPQTRGGLTPNQFRERLKNKAFGI
jgi:hypothetical protein